MQDVFDKLKPIFARLKQCETHDKALSVLEEHVKKGTLSQNEGFALGFLYLEDKRKKTTLKQTPQAKKDGFVMHF